MMRSNKSKISPPPATPVIKYIEEKTGEERLHDLSVSTHKYLVVML